MTKEAGSGWTGRGGDVRGKRKIEREDEEERTDTNDLYE